MTDAARLALGSAQWGLRYGVANRTGQPSGDEVAAIAALAWRAGIRTVDTARAYGSAEEAIGALAQPWHVVTKLGPDVAGTGVDEAGARARAAASLDASRHALRRDRLDTVLLHRAAHLEESGGGAWTHLVAERAAGRIGRIGASVVSPAEAEPLLRRPDVEVIQVPASLLDQRLQRAGWFAAAERAGRAVFVRSAYLQGVAHLPAESLPAHLAPLEPVLRTLDGAARAHGVSRATLFLAWARHRLGAARVLVGCETLGQLEANLAAWRTPGLEVVVREVEDRVPELPDVILDPWRWPTG